MATIGATIAHMSISYVSSKAAYDLHEGRIREIHVKKEINPAVLKRELELVLSERGVGSETVKAMMEIIGDDMTLLSNLLKSIKLPGEVSVPKEAIKTTGLFLITGALPILLPFFIGQAWDSHPWIPAVVAFFLAILIISGAGFFIAVLSAKKILVKIAHSISVIMGTCVVTYMVGLAARIFFGIEAAH